MFSRNWMKRKFTVLNWTIGCTKDLHFFLEVLKITFPTIADLQKSDKNKRSYEFLKFLHRLPSRTNIVFFFFLNPDVIVSVETKSMDTISRKSEMVRLGIGFTWNGRLTNFFNSANDVANISGEISSPIDDFASTLSNDAILLHKMRCNCSTSSLFGSLFFASWLAQSRHIFNVAVVSELRTFINCLLIFLHWIRK